MKDFRLRHVNRGESGKKLSRKHNSKAAAGVVDIGNPTSPYATAEEALLAAQAASGDINAADLVPGVTPSRTQHRDSAGATADDADISNLASAAAAVRRGKGVPAKSRDAANSAEDNDESGSDSETETPYAGEFEPISRPALWRSALEESMESLIDRKKAKSNQAMREKNLAKFIYILRHVYVTDAYEEKLPELLPAFLRSAQSGATIETEALLALEAISVLAATVGSSPSSQSLFLKVYRPVKGILSSDAPASVKAAAIRTLGSLCYFLQVPSQATLNTILALFSSIVISDGQSIDAHDNAAVVAAAQQMWTFVVTKTGVSRDRVAEPMEGFVDQLDSVDTDVRLAAGEGLVTVYELSYVRKQPSNDNDVGYLSDDDSEDDDYEVDPEKGEEEVTIKPRTKDDLPVARCEKNYNQVFPPLTSRQHDQVLPVLLDLSRISARNLSAENKRRLHAAFSDIYNSISRHPLLGPEYNTSLDFETGRERGSRLFVTLDGLDVPIRHWWQLVRYQSIRNILRNGVSVHYSAKNPVVVDSLKKAPPRARSWTNDKDEEELSGDEGDPYVDEYQEED